MSEPVADGVRAPLPGRCGFYVERKRRFCKMIVGEGKKLCGEHATELKEGETSKKRIPCPLDPKHTVYEDQLKRHLRKCNSREKPQPVYYVKDINSGSKRSTDSFSEQDPISSLSEIELENLIRKLRNATKGLDHKLEDRTLSHSVLQEALNDPNNGDSAFKHLKQQASILGNMDRLGLLGPGKCYVEFGAGRGKLSHWVDIALEGEANKCFLLVERATTRFKVDGKHRKQDSTFERLHIDIQHLCLNKVPVLIKEKLEVVGIGKHLCGAATDLALRCLVESYTAVAEEPIPKRLKNDTAEATDNSAISSDAPRHNASEKSLPVTGIVIALCCHHRCDWVHYVGKAFFQTLGLSEDDFGIFQRLSSWATCGRREKLAGNSISHAVGSDQDNDAERHDYEDQIGDYSFDGLQRSLTVEDREHIGRLCKLLIDHGRIHYLQQMGYQAALQYYADPAVSLENVLLTAVPSR
ncbi:tRNA:m(4)X modification enzyme TRM13 homolog isoform X2 [Ambystoma mexicanum]|uniref:tRNA:m(4)X modification enzyme TRM13 homolog isoform X2 n=1 Tax=Ambystoma mexicanum TaxID=8296 RepID=UPI0037E8E3C8